MRFQELCIVGPHAPSLRSDCRLEETLLPATTAVLPFRKDPESAEGGPVGEGRAIGRSVITAPAGRRGRKQGTLPQRSLIRTAASPAGTTVRNVPVGDIRIFMNPLVSSMARRENLNGGGTAPPFPRARGHMLAFQR